MLYVAILLAGGYPVLMIAVLKYLRDRDQAEHVERVTLNDRYASQFETLVARHVEQISAVVAQLREAQESRRDEIAALLQRIQAPEQAVIEHVQRNAPPDDVWPLTDEESLKAHEERMAAVAEIERMELEGVMP